ncbi:hypothetical protein [Pseudonocardia nigra]|uniref:hypothetical protein n=1 Tax=Pseudonocardia nigra TaxID=1921578 RepID=UPI001C5DC098|nr:hypothetical protein [Pseudonocardia nigra]
MVHEREFARDLAREVLSRMMVDGGPAWRVLGVDRYEEKTPPFTDPDGIHHLRITLGKAPDNADAGGVYFTVGVSREDAIVATANQIQDHVVEATRGAALPACPGHQHPLSATWLDGRASWVCPKDPAHHSEPILRAPENG